MNKRKLRLEKYGISKHRYSELVAFCRQYPEWVEKLEGMTSIRGKEYYASPKPSNINTSDPTGSKAVVEVTLLEKRQLVERIAKEAAKDLWIYIIKGVCYEEPLAYLQCVENMPCDRTTYYDNRRMFFYLLDKAKD